jgi:hypothetical protein
LLIGTIIRKLNVYSTTNNFQKRTNLNQ